MTTSKKRKRCFREIRKKKSQKTTTINLIGNSSTTPLLDDNPGKIGRGRGRRRTKAMTGAACKMLKTVQLTSQTQ